MGMSIRWRSLSPRRRVLACLALVAGALIVRVPRTAHLDADFPRHSPTALAHFLADFTNHPRLYTHITGTWFIEEEWSNYTCWKYTVSYECGPRCSGRASLVAHDTAQHHAMPHDTAQHHAMPHDTAQHHAMTHDTAQHHAMPHDTAQHHAMPHDTAQHHAMTHDTAQHHAMPHDTAQHHAMPHDTVQHHAMPHDTAQQDSAPLHRLLVRDTLCTKLPLLPWPQLCEETEIESTIMSRAGGGARLAERARAWCGLRGAGGCGVRAARLRHLRALRGALDAL